MTLTEGTSHQAAHRLCTILADLNFGGGQHHATPGSFARPNFELIVRLLSWLLRILDPAGVDTYLKPVDTLRCDKYRPNDVPEMVQVEFLKMVARKFHELQGIQLDLLALYRADLASCPELLKLAEIVHESAKLVVSGRVEQAPSVDKSLKGPRETEWELKQKLSLFIKDEAGMSLGERSHKLAQTVADLEKLLAEGEKLESERTRALEHKVDVKKFEKYLDESIVCLKRESESLAGQIDEHAIDMEQLDVKLRAKAQEISEATIMANELTLTQSPAYLERQSKLRNQYELAYDRYVSTFRTLTQLKSCLYSKQEDDDGESDGDRSMPETGAGEHDDRLVHELLFGRPADQSDQQAEVRSGFSGGRLELGNKPVELLESLLDLPEAQSLDLARDTDELDRAPPHKRPPIADDLRKSGRDAEFELDKLLDEFGAFDVVDPAGGSAAPLKRSSGGDDDDNQEDDELADDNQSNDDDDDDVDEDGDETDDEDEEDGA